jgi:hypothetical protein
MWANIKEKKQSSLIINSSPEQYKSYPKSRNAALKRLTFSLLALKSVAPPGPALTTAGYINKYEINYCNNAKKMFKIKLLLRCRQFRTTMAILRRLST